MKQRAAKQNSRVLGVKTFGAISAVEGLRLSAESKKRVETLLTRKLTPDARRAEIVRAYAGKGHK